MRRKNRPSAECQLADWGYTENRTPKCMSGSPPTSWHWTWWRLWRERQNPKLIPHKKVIPN